MEPALDYIMKYLHVCRACRSHDGRPLAGQGKWPNLSLVLVLVLVAFRQSRAVWFNASAQCNAGLTICYFPTRPPNNPSGVQVIQLSQDHYERHHARIPVQERQGDSN